jgi:hypothetical protein
MKPYRKTLLGKSSYWIIALAAAISLGKGTVVFAQQASPAAQVQPTAPSADAVFTAAELDEIVAPIALYPDALLAQVLPASAYPLDIVLVQRWLDRNAAAVAKQDFSGLDSQPWDPAVKALARFPEVIRKMNDYLDWTTDLGDAFVNQPQDVAEAIQRMRAKAQTTGALRTNQQQKIVKQTIENREIIIIESANPEVIYVPIYDPVQVFNPAAGIVAASLLTFGTAVAIGSVWNNNYWNWNSGIVYPPRWPGYPGFRPGWGGGNNVNIGNDINIGNINVGNNIRPWRPDGDRYRPGQGSKPGLRPENRPGNRPEGGLNRPSNRPEGGLTRPGNRPEGGNRPGEGSILGQTGVGAAIGAGVGAGIVAGNRPEAIRPQPGTINRPGNERPGAGAGNRPGVNRPVAEIQRPTSRPAPRPEVRPNPVRPGGAFGGIDAGRAPAQAFSNRGGQSINRGAAVGAGRQAAGRQAPIARPAAGGGGGRVGGGGGHGGRR